MKIAIIGSGLAAVATAKSLIARGVKPIILDVGERLDLEKKTRIETLSKLEPEKWSSDDFHFIMSNPTIYNKKSLPKKLVFGSDYFYGKSNENAPIQAHGAFPPFSYAKGGFSIGWGGVVQPPDENDLINWPLGNAELSPYYAKVLADLPYSAVDDDLTKNFPLISNNLDPIELTRGNKSLLRDLKKSNLLEKDNLVFGQSRLLVRASDEKESYGCKRCGCCLSGCVYDCIYKASHDIDHMITRNSIEYFKNIFVQSVKEVNNKVKVFFLNKQGDAESLLFDRVFLAAGAVGSTRIVLQSKKLYDNKVLLKSTLSFVAPMLRLKRSPIDWPFSNTQPGLFLEYKVPELSNHWVHTQLSTPNEMVFNRLNINPQAKGFIQRIKRHIAEHLVIALCNMHSEHSNGYELMLKKSPNTGNDTLVSSRFHVTEPHNAVKKAARRLASVGRKINCYSIAPFVQDSTKSGSYHVGGTLPMKRVPEFETDTNIWGSPKGWSRVHVVDSSVFPSIPGTTIGLLAMANAARIASEVDL